MVGDVRNVAQAEATANRAPPATRADASPNAHAALRVAGTKVKTPPHILEDLEYLVPEESLCVALHGDDALFGEELSKRGDTKDGAHTNQTETSPNDLKLVGWVRLNSVVNAEPELKFLESVSPQMASCVRDMVLRPLMDKTSSMGDSNSSAHECDCASGILLSWARPSVY